MPLQVIGAGYGRTGTASLCEALNILGFPSYHMKEVFMNHPEHIPIWLAASNGNKVDWEEIWRDEYIATVDWPGVNFYRQFADLYPSAKVVLSVRDFDAWYASAMETIYPASTSSANTIMGIFRPSLSRVFKIASKLVFEDTFHGRFLDKEYVRKVFNDHVEEVKRVVPANRLLVFEVKQGWAPLCEFLDVPVPTVPFPNTNDRSEFKHRILMMRATAYSLAAVTSVAVSAVAYFGLKFLGYPLPSPFSLVKRLL